MQKSNQIIIGSGLCVLALAVISCYPDFAFADDPFAAIASKTTTYIGSALTALGKITAICSVGWLAIQAITQKFHWLATIGVLIGAAVLWGAGLLSDSLFTTLS